MLNILICDDEPAVAAGLAQRIRSLPDYSDHAMRLRCITQPGEMLAEDLSPYDLLFLDIDMGAVNGIDLARRLRQTRPDAVLIFVTNYIEYAPEGYEVNAFRYLSKQELELRLPRYFSDALAVCRARQSTVEILCKGEPLPLEVRSLIYIESTGHEQCLHLKDARRETLATRMTMTELENLLAPHGFLRWKFYTVCRRKFCADALLPRVTKPLRGRFAVCVTKILPRNCDAGEIPCRAGAFLVPLFAFVLKFCVCAGFLDSAKNV